MTKYICSFLFIILTATNLFAQKSANQKITGIVKTTDGYPAEFVSVSLLNTTHGCVTDEKGEFEFRAPAGEYTMSVYSITAHRKEFPVSIKSTQQNYFPDITVIENKQQLEQVVVTGQISPQSLRNSVYKIRVIDKEKIEQKAATSVQSVLSTEVGIRLSNDMALGETDIELMGMSGNNVKVLIDGVPLIDRSDKKQSLTQIDVNTIERIEIVEGPMSVMYGTDALAGVINIITKSGKSKDGHKLSVGARLQEETLGKEYDFMSVKGSHLQSVNGQYNFDNGLYAGANFSHNEFGGWKGDLKGRAKQWPSKKQLSTGGKVGISRSNYNIAYKLDYMNENTLKKGDVPVNKKASDEEFKANRYTHQLQGSWQPTNRWSLAFAGSYQDYSRDKRTTVTNFKTGEKTPSTAEEANDDTEYSMWFARINASWKALHNLNILAGFEYTNNDGTGDKVEKNIDTSISNEAIFVSAEYSPVEWLDIRPGARWSHNSKYDAPLVIPSLNLKIKLKESMDLRLSYGRGFRAPTLQELYYDFYHVNGGGFWIKGNPDLKAEKSDSYMASYVWRSFHNENVRLTSTLSGFYNNFRNGITRIETDDVVSTYKYYNVDKYRTIGFSLENTLAWKSLEASLNVSYIGRYNNYQDDDGYATLSQDKMRYSPEISASLSYDWTKIATFNLFYKFTGSRREYLVVDNALVLGGLNSYNWADFTLSRSIVKGLKASAGIKNIFDITTIDRTANTSSGKDVLSSSPIACGRSYFVGLTYNFNK